MKRLAVLAVCALAGVSHAEELYNNGPVVNAFGRSVLRPPASTLGFGAQTVEGNTVADDFTVGAEGWLLTDIDFFAYQTGAGAFSFTDVTWSIVSGDINGGTVVASGTTAVTDGGLVGYRVTNTTRRNTDRAIYDLNADVADLELAAGSYWLTWNIAGSSDFSGPWVPPTSDRRTGNGQQAIAGGAFADALDLGNGNTVEFPFILNGSVVPEPQAALTLLAGLAALGGLARRRAPRA